jgi:pyruvate dehydrogenase (quinone)
LYDAKLDCQPVLAITGHHYHDLIGTHAQQDVALDKLFMDVAVYNTRIMGFAHVESVTHLACRTALGYRGVAHINFPTDVQDFTSDERSKRDVPGHTTAVMARGGDEPDERELGYAADILNRGKKVAILAGRGALGAGAELEEVAELLAAPIVKALLGKAAVPDNSPYTTGGIRLLGTRASQETLEQCDTLLLVGTSFPYIEFMPKPGQAKAVQIDIDPARIGLRYPVDVGLVADTRSALKALRQKLTRHGNRDFLTLAQKATKEWWLVDSNEPPMPAKITVEQAEKFAESLIRGTPHRGKIALTVLSDKVRELV